MHYPWLDVPFLTAPMLIAIIALLHVFVSHYAVGGGLILAMENWRAHRSGDEAYRAYWKKHAKFFISLTVVYGASTGVGVWQTIGLASPFATEKLIRIFAFGWAIEWCFFLLEIVSGFALYYFWDGLKARAHVFVSFVYAASAWISLVLITGITAFMLNSQGLLSDWESTGGFWDAFLNVQFIPQTIARTGCALLLGALYVLLHASAVEKDLDIRELVVKRMRLPAFLGLFFLVVGIVGWFYFLPESSKATLERAAATNLFSGLFAAIVFAILLLLIAGPVARPRETTFASSLALFLFGIACVGVGEFVREAVRKPYIVDRVVYSCQIAREDVAKTRQTGLLYAGTWTTLYLDALQEEYPDLKISAERYLGLPSIHIEPFVFEEPTEKDEREEDGEGTNEGTSAPDEELAPEENDELAFQTQNAYVELTQARSNVDGASRFAPANGERQYAARQQARPSAQDASARQVPPQTQNALAPRSNELGARPQTSSDRSAPDQARERALAPRQNVASETNGRFTAEAAEPPLGVPEASSPVAPNDEEEVDDEESAEEEEEPALNVVEADLKINGPIARGNEDLLKVERQDRLDLGRVVFLHHCNACHAAEHGYSAVGPLLAGRPRDAIRSLALTLDHTTYYMPPWCGSEVEAELLAEYLESIAPKFPANVFAEPKPKKEKKTEEDDEDAEGEEEEELSEDETSDAALLE